LNPGHKGIGIKYDQFQNIAEIAATYWKSMQKSKKTCTELLSQLRKYRLQQRPYNVAYNNQYDNPLSWWYTCEDNYDHLQQLAIKLFSVVPHSGGCERIFSYLGQLYGKNRQNLNINSVNNIAKIHYFYLSNVKNILVRLYQKRI